MVKKRETTVMSVQGRTISTVRTQGEDYISLTDMVRGAENSDAIIQNWLRNKNTIEFLGLWEQLHNPEFKPLEFEGFKQQAGTNRFVLSPKKWIASTGARGLLSTSGRYGGTYAQKDIAFEFGAWLSPEFKLLLIHEFHRLKERELDQREWDVPRFLSKINYRIQTDAVKEVLIPKIRKHKDLAWLLYAEEGDLINVVVFNQTAKEWRTLHPDLARRGENVRDTASILQLTLVSNLEMLNAHFIRDGLGKEVRYQRLADSARIQMRSLERGRAAKRLLMPPDRP